MTRYIDADAFKNGVMEAMTKMSVTDGAIPLQIGMMLCNFADDTPTADVQEVKHGKWIICGAFDDLIKCSCCVEQGQGRNRPIPYYGFPKWCEDCGAKMDLGD